VILKKEELAKKQLIEDKFEDEIEPSPEYKKFI